MSDHARNVTDGLDWDTFSGRGDPEQRFALYRLCDCTTCEGKGKGYPTAPGQFGSVDVPLHRTDFVRCPECRGEGRVREMLATCESEAAVGVTLCTLAREGEWEECPLGLLDREGETGKKWLILPWLPSPRNASDAGKLLRSRRK